MKIALINENSQNSKNGMIEAALKKVVGPMGHQVFNFGMYAAEGSHPLTYVQNGILAATLLNRALPGVLLRQRHERRGRRQGQGDSGPLGTERLASH